MPDLDSLVVSVQASSTSAVKDIENLGKALDGLNKKCQGLKGLSGISNKLAGLSNLKFDANGLNSVSTLLDKLSSMGSVKLSSTLGKTLERIADATNSLSDNSASKIANLSASLQSMEQLGSLNVSNVTKFLNALPGALNSADNANMDAFTSKMESIKSALSTFGGMDTGNVSSVLASIGKIPNIVKGLDDTTLESFTKSVNKLTEALTPLVDMLKQLEGVDLTAFSQVLQTSSGGIAGAAAGIGSNGYVGGMSPRRLLNTVLIHKVASAFKTLINQSNEYIESMNLANVSLGEYAQQAQNYADKVSDVMGIDPAQWMKTQGIFMTLASGFGVASEKASVMSQQLTQLSYDIASFFNLDVETAMLKVQSGLSGELEPMRRIGYDLSEARLKAIALELGITKAYQAMSQAEKSQLRYYAMMTQVTQVQGDMARTLDAPANQLRVLKAAATQAARAIGNILIPALNAILPVAIAVMNVIRNVAAAIASLFGFVMPSVDYSSGLSSVADAASSADKSLGGAAGSAKELKKTIMGFDEINLLNDNNAGGGGGGGGAIDTDAFDFDLPTYDFLGNAISKKIEAIQEKLEGILPYITSIAAGIAAWKIADFFMNDLGTVLAKLEKIKTNKAVGIGLLVTGFTLSWQAGWDIGKNGVTLQNMLETGIGAAIASVGGYIVGGSNGAVSAGLISIGLTVLSASISADSTDWGTFKSGFLKVIGSALTGVGIGLVFNPVAGVITFATALLVSVVAGKLRYDKAKVKADIASRFGELSLTDEEIQDLVNRSVDAEFAIKMTAFIDEVKTVDDAIAEYNKSNENLTDTTNKIMLGAVIPAERVETAVNDAIKSAQAFLDGQKELAELTIPVAFSDPTVSAQMSSWMKTYFSSLETQLEEKGHALRQVLDEAMFDGVIDANEAEMIAKAQAEYKQLLQMLVDAENDAMAESIKIRNGAGSDFSLDTIKSVMDGYVEGIKTATANANEALEQGLKYAYLLADGDKDSAYYKQAAMDATNTWLKNRATLGIDGLTWAMGEFNKAYSEVGGALPSVMKNLSSGVENISGAMDWSAGVSDLQNIKNYASMMGDVYREAFRNSGLSSTAKKSLDETIKALEPTAQQLQAIKDDAEAAGAQIPDGVMEALTSYHTMRALAGEMDSIMWLAGQEMSKSDAFQKALKNADADSLFNVLQTGMLDGIQTAQPEISTAVDGIATTVENAVGDAVKNANDDLSTITVDGTQAISDATETASGISAELSNINVDGSQAIESTNAVLNSVANMINGFSATLTISAVGGAYSGSKSGLKNSVLSNMTSRFSGKFATGGFPDRGSIFIANEEGAEMVGSIGGNTAVANNDQIVSGIATGVRDANNEQNNLLRAQNDLLRQILAKTGLSIDGRAMTSMIESYQNNMARARG